MPSFKYQEGKSLLFGTIKRPLIELEIYSTKSERWIAFSDIRRTNKRLRRRKILNTKRILP